MPTSVVGSTSNVAVRYLPGCKLRRRTRLGPSLSQLPMNASASGFAAYCCCQLLRFPVASVLDANGPVAESTARAMADGIAARCDADWGLAVTGVAGPEPQDGHPVGEVYVAVAYRPAGLVRSRQLALTGDRATIRGHTAHQGLRLLADALSAEAISPGSASTAMSVVD